MAISFKAWTYTNSNGHIEALPVSIHPNPSRNYMTCEMSTTPMGGRHVQSQPLQASQHQCPRCDSGTNQACQADQAANGRPNKLAPVVNKVDIELLQGPGTTCMEYNILYYINTTSRLYSANWPQWGITLIKQHNIHKYTHPHKSVEFMKFMNSSK